MSFWLGFASFAVAGWLLGLCVGFFARPLSGRAIVGSAGLIVFAGAIVGGVYAGGDEPVAGPAWALGAAAGWIVGIAAATLIGFVHGSYSQRAPKTRRERRTPLQ